jgi:predicted nucleotidyltransferase
MRGIYLERRGADRSFVARGMSLRHLRPARFRRRRAVASVELLTLRVAELVAERQQLRERGANDTALERNRIQIARAQWELGHALIDRHLQPASQSAA